MDLTKYEYQSDFAKRYLAQGEATGRAAIIMKLLVQRFGPLSDELQTELSRSSIDELDAIAERLMAAGTLQEALRSPRSSSS